MNKLHVLLVDDDKQFAQDFQLLGNKIFEINWVENGETALVFLETHQPDAILLDLQLGAGMDGLETLKQIRRLLYDIPVLIITEFAGVETAVRAIKLGALHYLAKNPNMKELQALIERELQHIRWKKLYQDKSGSAGPIIGQSQVIAELRRLITRVAQTDSSVIIEGESGAGKELVALEIHRQSARAEMPFVAIDCGAITSSLFESELFGHEKGAFTDAKLQKKGKLELANHGTIFLDEIANLDYVQQGKLLRAIESGVFMRVGGTKEVHVDIRVLSAANKNLLAKVENNTFREDLYYRLNVVTINCPPLRERKEDIPDLVNYFAMFGQQAGRPLRFSKDAMQKLKNYPWPGNVRELKNMVTRLYTISSDSEITAPDIHFDRTITSAPGFFDGVMDKTYAGAANQVLAEFKKIYLTQVLQRNNWNITQAAIEADIPRTSLHRMIKELGLIAADR